MLEKALDSIVPKSIALSFNQRGVLAFPTEAEKARDQLFSAFVFCLLACFFEMCLIYSLSWSRTYYHATQAFLKHLTILLSLLPQCWGHG